MATTVLLIPLETMLLTKLRLMAMRAVMMVVVSVEELLLEKCHEEESHYDRCWCH